MVKIAFAIVFPPVYAPTSGSGFVAPTDPNFTGIYLNGNYWAALPSRTSKMVFLLAYGEGAQLSTLFMRDREEGVRVQRITAPTATGISVADQIRVVDEFYRDPANRPVPLCMAFQFAVGVMRGYPEEWVAEAIAKMRRYAGVLVDRITGEVEERAGPTVPATMVK